MHCGKNNSETQRILWIDFARSLAIIGVVMCHVVEGNIYEFNLVYMENVNAISKLFAFLVFSVGRLGVPFFLMITGYLLFDREYNYENSIKFWKKKCLGLIIAVEFWHIVYNTFEIVVNKKDIDFITVIKQMLMLEPSSMNHMWYMPMILGMYLTLPLVARALRTIEIKIVIIPYLVTVILTFGINTANVLFSIMGKNLGTTIISTGFSGGVYGAYLITGYLIKKDVLKMINTKCVSILAASSFVCVVFMQLLAYRQGIMYNVWYDNLFLFICGIACFELISRLKGVPWKNITIFVSKYSFAIYLVHNPINILIKNATNMIEPRPLRVIVVWVATILVSSFIAFLINKIPKIGKMILYMR